MRSAAARRVAIFGDYDVDGATASALLARFLRAAGLDPIIHIPDRIFEGYGPNVEAIRALAGRGATLLVTVDCGTTSLEPLAEAQRLGLDVVVIDHHQADEQLPPAVAVVNPNRLDDLSRLGHLAAVGLVFMTVVAVNRVLRARGFWTAARPEPDLLDLLDLVALGTVADVVPLNGLNRAFVAKGLMAMRRREHTGLTALMDVARLVRSARAVASRLPARPAHQCRRPHRPRRSRRAAPAAPTIRSRRRAIAAELDRLNRERQAIEHRRRWPRPRPRRWRRSASRRRARWWSPRRRTGIPGVVGLVAARLKERFGRPAFAIALEPGGIGTGSGRSIAGVDLGRAVRHAVAEGLLHQGRRPRHGGRHHACARARSPRSAPISRRRSPPPVRARAARPALADRRRGQRRRRDARALSRRIARAGPFGAGNPEPVVALPGHTLAYAEEVGQAHVRARLRAATARPSMPSRSAPPASTLGHALLDSRGQPVHAAGTLAIDRWQGEERVQFRICDVAPADPLMQPRGSDG